MSPAARALLRARLAGVTVARNGDRLRLEADAKPPDAILNEIRQHRLAILQLLAAERCEACSGPGTPGHPLLECAYAGHWLLLHRACLATFLTSTNAAAGRYAPQRVCDYCGRPGGQPGGGPGGRLETIGYRGGPIGGVPVHLECATAWFERLDAIPLQPSERQAGDGA